MLVGVDQSHRRAAETRKSRKGTGQREGGEGRLIISPLQVLLQSRRSYHQLPLAVLKKRGQAVGIEEALTLIRRSRNSWLRGGTDDNFQPHCEDEEEEEEEKSALALD